MLVVGLVVRVPVRCCLSARGGRPGAGGEGSQPYLGPRGRWWPRWQDDGLGAPRLRGVRPLSLIRPPARPGGLAAAGSGSAAGVGRGGSPSG